MNCILCGSLSSTELFQHYEKPLCLLCASEIASAYNKCSAKPQRRQQVFMRFVKLGLRVMPTDQRILEIAEHSTDEQIDGAIEIAKKSNAVSLGYISAILRSERTRKPAKAEPQETPKAATAERKEPWEREGFTSEADMLKCQDAYQSMKFKAPVGKCMKWPEFLANWQAEAL